MRPATGPPSLQTMLLPGQGSISPAMRRKRLDLPTPLGPSRHVHAPAASSILSASNSGAPPKSSPAACTRTPNAAPENARRDGAVAPVATMPRLSLRRYQPDQVRGVVPRAPNDARRDLSALRLPPGALRKYEAARHRRQQAA